MKKLLSVCVIITLLVGLLGTLPVSAAGSVNVWVGSTNVTINDTLTVTLAYNGGGEGIGSLDAKFHYNTAVFEYISCSGATARGDAGIITISYVFMEETPSNEVSITLKFKAISPGEGNFKLVTEGVYSDTGTLMENNTKTVAVTASNPTLSGNADLKSLVPSRGTLTPKFDPNVTDYTITVSNAVDSLSLSATPDHNGAKTSISGKNALQVGKNTRVVTVTAPNGTTKKYTVVINRAAAPSTSGSSSGTPTSTTPTLPPEDALKVAVNGKTMSILDTQASVDLPDGFKWSNIVVNRVEVPAAINQETGMTLLYLTAEDEADNGFYIYNATADTFTRYRRLKVESNDYLIFDLPVDQDTPAGTVKGSLLYDGAYVSAYTYEDAALSDFYIVWAAPLNGEAGWYTYDKKEGSFQRYHATPGSEMVSPSTTAKKTTKTTLKAATTTAKAKSGLALSSFVKEYRNLWLYGLIAIGCIVIVVIGFILLVAMSRRGKGKH